MVKSINIKKAAQQYKKELLITLKKASEGKNLYSNGFSDCWVADISNHVNVCNKIINSKKNLTPSQVNSLLWSMDTACRDWFPEIFFVYADME